MSVRGLTYSNRADTCRRLDVGDWVVLEREPGNPYDANAIRVRLTDESDLGYVARNAARGLTGRLDEDPEGFEATVREVDADAPMLRLELRSR